MACEKCEERRRKLRDAIIRGKLAEAGGHVVAGISEIVTPKSKAIGSDGSSGGGISEMGKAGPEAIMPLKRGKALY
ncbi:hypothetical protein WBP06_09470 [Novosphingobium sp. BL-8H]|uniref:hypothetical protein n=1 Tax=Novosphingobium sp. BL-8H TaxID=3127640 RepID=UPI003757611B